MIRAMPSLRALSGKDWSHRLPHRPFLDMLAWRVCSTTFRAIPRARPRSRTTSSPTAISRDVEKARRFSAGLSFNKQLNSLVASRQLEVRDPGVPVDRGSDLAHLVVLVHIPERAAIHGVSEEIGRAHV